MIKNINSKKKNILILGGASFLGMHLSLYLSKYYNVDVVISKKRNYNLVRCKRIKLLKKNFLTIIKLNLLNKDEVMQIKKKYFFIINCIGWTDNYNNDFLYNNKLVKQNYKNFYNILQLLFDNTNCKNFIEMGSSLEYGQSYKKFNEDSSCNPNTKYGKLKLSNTIKLKRLFSRKINVVVLRIFSIFGYLDKQNKLIEIFKKNKKVILKHPHKFQDFISIKYLKLLVNKIIMNKKNKKFKIINICSGVKLSPIDIINNINLNKIKKINFKIKDNYNYNHNKNFGCYGSNLKLRNILKIKQINPINDIIDYLKF